MPKNLPKSKVSDESLPKAEPQPRIEEMTRGPRFERFYANHAQVQNSFYDFRLQFNHVVQATKERLEVEEQCTVSMSPEHAVDLFRALSSSIDGYEKKHGTIRRGPAPEPTDEPE